MIKTDNSDNNEILILLGSLKASVQDVQKMVKEQSDLLREVRETGCPFGRQTRELVSHLRGNNYENGNSIIVSRTFLKKYGWHIFILCVLGLIYLRDLVISRYNVDILVDKVCERVLQNENIRSVPK